MALLRALLAHDLRTAVRARGDARGRARQSRLAGLAHVRIDSRRDGLRANLRDGVQPDRGPQIRRSQSAHGESSPAERTNWVGERDGFVRAVRRGTGRRELFFESALLLPFTRRAG